MQPSKVRDEMKEWSEQLGLSPIGQHQVPDVDFAVSFGLSGLEDLSFEDLDAAMVRLSSYLIYLSSQKGSVMARLSLIESSFNQRLNAATEKMLGDNRWRTYPERRALAIRLDSRLRELEAKVMKLKAQAEKLRDLPHSIEVKVNVLKSAYQRKVYASKDG